MNDFIFALDATLPIFIVILVGYYLRKFNILSEEFIKPCNKFNYAITLPVLLIVQMSNVCIKDEFDLTYLLYCFFTTVIAIFAIWILARKLIKDKTKVGAFTQASYRSSVAVIGMAFVLNVYGSLGLTPLMIIGSVPLFNIMAVIILSIESGKKIETKELIIDVIKNPILIAVVLGTILSFIDFQMPIIMYKSLNSIASMASPLALICIGAAFNINEAKKSKKISIVSTIVKLVVLPAVFLPIAILLGFKGIGLLAVLIMLGAPSTPSCYIFAQMSNNDENLSSSVIVLTTLFSSVSLTLWIYILRCMTLL